MHIPKVLKVGAQRLIIRQSDIVFALDGEPVMGLTKTGTGRIEISTTYHGEKCPEDSIADTFLHEICHSVSAIYGLDLSETQVIGLAGGLLQVIRDNNLDFRKS
jgi:hypothetical protein